VEVAETLCCSEKTIRRRIAAGTLPASKQGGRRLFEAAAIRAALIAGLTRPQEALSAPSFSPARTAR
jgi:excisionase family DNA binding protein